MNVFYLLGVKNMQRIAIIDIGSNSARLDNQPYL